ncbi:MAG: helical backbone metal receptor [Candidatus Cloacimonadales bacterium]|nr:helical backbone metal receptor [Candidatus Cloacimonadota bacterium]MDX9977025.1 helical backbone metal receptor [Candidatus Cloacimonadales bacterium]
MKKTFLIIFLLSLVIMACQQELPKNGIVVISPELAEIIVKIAGDGQIIGVTEECNFPQILQFKEKVGNFGQVNLEKIALLRPEYVITSSLEQEGVAKDLEKLGIKVISIYPKSIDEMFAAITELGIITKTEKNAEKLISELKEDIDELKNYQPKNPKKVFVEIYNDPIMSVSAESYIGSLVELAGGINIFPVLERDYSRVKNESIILANPDVIITTYPGIDKDTIKNRKGWEHINAVKNNEIYTIEDVNPDLIVRATPRNIEGVKLLRSVIYE